MKKDLYIINEISRMREMMGFGDLKHITKKYINESINGNTKYLLTEAVVPKDEWISILYKAITGDDSFSERFGKSVSDEWDAGARQLADVLEREGLDDIGRLQDFIARGKGIDKSLVDSEMIDQALKLYFKNNPSIAEEILKNSARFKRSILNSKDFINILGASNTQLADNLRFLINYFTLTSVADGLALKPDLDNIITTFKNSGLDLNDPNISEILKDLEDFSKTIDSMDATARPTDVNPNAAYIPSLATNKTKADIDAENAAREAELKRQKDIDDAQTVKDEAEERFRLDAEEGLENALLKLKSHPDWPKAWSPWQKLMEKLGMGDAAAYITRAENVLNGSNLNTYEDFVNSQLFRTLETELMNRASKRKAGKGSSKSNIDNATGILASIKKFFGELPFIGRIAKTSSKVVGRVIATIISVALIYWIIDNIWDIGDIARDLKDWAWDTKAGSYLFGDPNTDKEFCLRQIEGYYEIPEDDRVKLLGTPITCSNLDKDNYATFISNIKYLKGGSVMDGSGNTVTKKDRFEVTIGGKKLEYEIGGGSTPPTPSPTPPTTTPSGTYTNTQDDFIRWVNANHPGKYGSDYEWEGTAGYYYPSGGTTGNAMTFSSSGWQ